MEGAQQHVERPAGAGAHAAVPYAAYGATHADALSQAVS